MDVPTLRNGLSGPTGSGNYYSNVEFVIIIHRNFWYYVWKVLAIVYLLIMSMFVIFVMDPIDDFADRINICLTLFLAAVAFLYVVGESLPKVPYLTLLDKVSICLGSDSFGFVSGYFKDEHLIYSFELCLFSTHYNTHSNTRFNLSLSYAAHVD